jgi:hypothetical protein
MSFTDDRFYFMGNSHGYNFNRKLCFQARDALFDCVDDSATGNGNKFRCPDQLYAYEMWCPADFRRIHSNMRRKNKIDEDMNDAEWVKKVNIDKQTLKEGHYSLV